MKKIDDSNVMQSQTDETLKLRLLERLYVLNHFQEYIKNHTTNPFGSYMLPDYKAYIASQVMIYTDGLFTLPQLKVLNNATIEYNSTDIISEGLSTIKYHAINIINDCYLDDEELGDVKSFLRKITSLNSIVFNTLIYLIHDSYLFWDIENEEDFYPDVKAAIIN